MPLRLSDLPADLLARLVQCTLNDEAAWAPVAPCDCDGGALQPAPIRALALRLRGIDKAFCSAVASPDAFPRLMSLHTYSSDPLGLQIAVHTLGHAIGTVTLGVRLGEQRLRACLLRCVNATCLTIEDSPWPPGGYAALQPEHLLRLLSGVLPKLTTLKVTVDSIWSDTYAARLAAVCPLLEALTVHMPQTMLTNMPLVSYRPFANLREVALVSDQSTSVQHLLDTLAACPRLQKLGGLMLNEYGPDIAELDCSALSQLSELTLASGPQGRSLPCLLRQCSNLTKLGLWGVRVEGSSIRQLVAALTCKLASLDLGSEELHSDDGEDFCDADVISLCRAQPALTALSLLTTEYTPLISRGYDITDNALAAMHNLQSLELLRIEDANMENISVAALDALVRACPRLRKVVLARVGEPDDWPDDAQPSSNALRAVDELLRERGGELEDGDVLEESDSDDTTDSDEEGI